MKKKCQATITCIAQLAEAALMVLHAQNECTYINVQGIKKGTYRIAELQAHLMV